MIFLSGREKKSFVDTDAKTPTIDGGLGNYLSAEMLRNGDQSCFSHYRPNLQLLVIFDFGLGWCFSRNQDEHFVLWVAEKDGRDAFQIEELGQPIRG